MEEIRDIVNEMVEVVCKTDRSEHRTKRVKRTCEGCSAFAVQCYGYGGHPSQRRHMELGGCLSNESADFSSDEDTNSQHA